MRLPALLTGPTERSVLVFRVLVVCLSAIAYLSVAPFVDSMVVLLWGAYLCVAGLVSLRSRTNDALVAALMAAVDVGVIAGLIFLAPLEAPPLWPLYLFPLASAAISGSRIVAVVVVLSTASWAAHAWYAGLDPYRALPWPEAAMLAFALTVILLSGRWAVERSQRLVWREAALAGQSFWKGDLPEEAERSVIETIVQLARAEHGWLLRPRPDGSALVATRSTGAPETPPPAEEILASLGANSASSLSGDRWRDSLGGPIGEVIALRAEWAPVGAAVLVWKSPPADPVARRAATRVLSSSAAYALLAADLRHALRNEIRLEAALRRMGGQLASTLEPAAVASAVREGIASTIGASAALDGEELRLPLEAGPALTVRLRDDAGSLFVVPRRDSLGVPERRWLDQVADLVGGALARCSDHLALRTEESRLRASLESIPAPVVVNGPDGVAVLANREYWAMCGPNRGLPVPLSMAPGVEEEVIIGEPPRTFIVNTASVDGKAYRVSVFREVTREREALRVKDELIAMAGHELRSPLTSISGYSQMMARQLSVVQRQISQLDQLIGDFMEASSFNDAQLSLTMQPLSVADLARGAADRFAGAHPTRPLKLDIGPVPEICGDPARLGQVLDNLLSNGDKYSPAADSEIVLGAREESGGVLLWVRDRGLGIAPEHLPSLFERYYRVRSEETQGVKGLGLGLSIVRDLVEAHGGSVWAESEGRGHGSTFWVSLPPAAAEPERTVLLPPPAGPR
jgi:PAS domain-containing protein